MQKRVLNKRCAERGLEGNRQRQRAVTNDPGGKKMAMFPGNDHIKRGGRADLSDLGYTKAVR